MDQQPPDSPHDPVDITSSPRDKAYWASPVSSLRVTPLPEDAINLNVEGRVLSGPIQGFGRMWQKRHRIRLEGSTATPVEVITVWKENFGDFWPKGNRFFGPLVSLRPGDVAVLNLQMPGGAQLSTGVMVLYADSESFSLMTPQGHLFSGWITFSAYDDGGCTVVQAEILMRASDPLFEIGMELMGHRRENLFWEQTLANVAARFGVSAIAETEVECIDPRRQWSQATNIRHNSAIRTGLYLGTAPLMKVVRRFRGATNAHAGPNRH